MLVFLRSIWIRNASRDAASSILQPALIHLQTVGTDRLIRLAHSATSIRLYILGCTLLTNERSSDGVADAVNLLYSSRRSSQISFPQLFDLFFSRFNDVLFDRSDQLFQALVLVGVLDD
jgi:hypothetical protein